jgi:hypothetical protein
MLLNVNGRDLIMTGKILERYTARNGANGASATATVDDSTIDDLGCFGWLRGIRDRAFSVELRRANGNIVAIPYHTIERFEFDPSEGIVLAVAGKQICLKGRNLNLEVQPTIKLFEGLARHRVPWIREAEDRGDLGRETVVESIAW